MLVMPALGRRRQADTWFSLSSYLCLPEKLQASERHCLKSQGGQLLRNVTGGCSVDMHTGAPSTLSHTKGVKPRVCLTRVCKWVVCGFSVYFVGKRQKDCWEWKQAVWSTQKGSEGWGAKGDEVCRAPRPHSQLF